MDFISKLRMANLFNRNPNAGTPFGMPQFGPTFKENLSSILPAIKSLRNDNWRREDFVYNRERANRLNDLANAMRRRPNANTLAMDSEQGQQQQPMRSVFVPSMTDYQRAQVALGRDRLEQQGELSRARLAGQTEDRELRRDNFDLAKFRAEHPGKRFDTSGPTIRIFDPVTGAIVDSGIETGRLSDADKAWLQHDYRTSENDQRAASQRERDEARFANERERDAARFAHDTERDANRADANLERDRIRAGYKTPSETQERQRQINEANRIINQYPDLAPFVIITEDGVRVTPPGQNSFFDRSPKPTQDQFNKINKFLYPPAPAPVAPTPKTTTPAKPTAPTSKYKVTIK